MTAEEVYKFLQMVIQQGNKKEDAVKIMAEWVGSYHGKVLQVETDGKFYHVIITKKGAKVREGEYPSPDIIFRAQSDLLMQIFTGRADPIEAIKKWEMVVVGNGHEMVPMNKMIMTIMMGM
jgi:putative sterol carrier protein